MPPKVKVCRIASVVEARMAVDHGAAAPGLDLCSRVRTGGMLDPAKLAVLMDAVARSGS